VPKDTVPCSEQHSSMNGDLYSHLRKETELRVLNALSQCVHTEIRPMLLKWIMYRVFTNAVPNIEVTL
jgi:hypothetical protein